MKRFDESVLPRTPRRHRDRLRPDARQPVGQSLADELRAVVAADHVRGAAAAHHPSQNPPDVGPSKPGVRVQDQTLPGVFVHQAQPLERTSLRRPIVNEIACPYVVLEPSRPRLAAMASHAGLRVGFPGFWIIPREDQGRIDIVDLGAAGPIEAAVTACRKNLEPEQDKLREQGEPMVENELQAVMKKLSALILRPLLSRTGNVQRWVISPDASLWLVPWVALPLEVGSYLVEKHVIHHLITGRDLLVSAMGRAQAEGRPVMMADPDFDHLPGNTDPQGDRQGEPAQDRLALRGLSRGIPLGRVSRLPGTATEAAAIAPKLTALATDEPRLLVGKDATEKAFKRLYRPQVLVLSTHGFFTPPRVLKPQRRGKAGVSTTRDPSQQPSENPLLRCGLLFAGFNERQQRTETHEDGILTGLEIVGTDLQGTRLVVLSACETGVGDIQNGEGVSGLRQAFQLAGADAVVATLWRIPDRESARIMVRFFQEWSEGRSMARALRNAQLQEIARRRQVYGAAHPFYWAAFTVTGSLGAGWDVNERTPGQ